MSNKMSEKTWRQILEALEVDEKKIKTVIGIINSTYDFDDTTLRRILEALEVDEKKIQRVIEIINAPSKKSLNIEVTEVLKKIGIPTNLLGFAFLREAVMISVEEKKNIYKRFTTQLYPQIAEQFETTPSRVERAIRHAIKVSWIRGDIEYQNKVFGNSTSANRGKPTNSEFIATISDIILRER